MMVLKTNYNILEFLKKHIYYLEDKELETKLKELRNKTSCNATIIDPIKKTSIFPNSESKEIFYLEAEYENKQNNYLNTLNYDEKIALLTLMYLGRDNNTLSITIENFKVNYNFYYKQCFNEKDLNSQMTGKGCFIYYLYQAISKIK